MKSYKIHLLFSMALLLLFASCEKFGSDNAIYVPNGDYSKILFTEIVTTGKVGWESYSDRYDLQYNQNYEPTQVTFSKNGTYQTNIEIEYTELETITKYFDYIDGNWKVKETVTITYTDTSKQHISKEETERNGYVTGYECEYDSSGNLISKCDYLTNGEPKRDDYEYSDKNTKNIKHYVLNNNTWLLQYTDIQITLDDNGSYEKARYYSDIGLVIKEKHLFDSHGNETYKESSTYPFSTTDISTYEYVYEGDKIKSKKSYSNGKLSYEEKNKYKKGWPISEHFKYADGLAEESKEYSYTDNIQHIKLLSRSTWYDSNRNPTVDESVSEAECHFIFKP